MGQACLASKTFAMRQESVLSVDRTTTGLPSYSIAMMRSASDGFMPMVSTVSTMVSTPSLSHCRKPAEEDAWKPYCVLMVDLPSRNSPCCSAYRDQASDATLMR